ncbi:unnamed protein product [Allacma fusca]|uniref:Right handed beta helix domain-containing protein n=1 Tax=Allacma fusca TaxID=39272 RepID=A0A8J2JRD8_9HEXA|nr:unnamed protein product [Allacma fusca]
MLCPVKILGIVVVLGVSVQGVVHQVSTVSQLKNALSSVNPGDIIRLAAGTYKAGLNSDRNGTATNPIIMEGPADAILTNTNYAFHLLGSYWILRGFTAANGKKGIVVDYGGHNILENLTVRDLEEEGIHFRFFSSDNIVRNCKVYNTGTKRPGYGEGIYIGQDRGKWVNNQPDKCDRIQIINNTIGPNCAGEGIDIKEGTCCGLIKGNYFDGHGLSDVNSDDSWVDVKGDSYIVEDNRGYWTLEDGFQVRDHMPVDSGIVSGCNNVFRRNHCDMYASGYCIYFANKGKCASNTVEDSNTLTNGGQMTNL